MSRVRWLIDGYNVIRQDPESQRAERLADRRGAGPGALEAARAALVRRIVEAQRRSGDPFTIVFDGVRGHPAPDRTGVRPGSRIEIVFSRSPETADDVLIRLAGRYREGGIVVTSDRTIQSAARRARALVVTSEQFLDALDPAAADDEEDEGIDDEGADRRRQPSREGSREARATARALWRLAVGSPGSDPGPE